MCSIRYETPAPIVKSVVEINRSINSPKGTGEGVDLLFAVWYTDKRMQPPAILQFPLPSSLPFIGRVCSYMRICAYPHIRIIFAHADISICYNQHRTLGDPGNNINTACSGDATNYVGKYNQQYIHMPLGTWIVDSGHNK